jgi:hypothetical protein
MTNPGHPPPTVPRGRVRAGIAARVLCGAMRWFAALVALHLVTVAYLGMFPLVTIASAIAEKRMRRRVTT